MCESSWHSVQGDFADAHAAGTHPLTASAACRVVLDAAAARISLDGADGRQNLTRYHNDMVLPIGLSLNG